MKHNTAKENKFSVLKYPRITEKASMLMEQGVYSFHVTDGATKTEIKKAVSALYKVNPVKVAIIKSPRKKVFIRGKTGFRAGVKKAYVYLKKGDKIEIN